MELAHREKRLPTERNAHLHMARYLIGRQQFIDNLHEYKTKHPPSDAKGLDDWITEIMADAKPSTNRREQMCFYCNAAKKMGDNSKIKANLVNLREDDEALKPLLAKFWATSSGKFHVTFSVTSINNI